MKEWEESNFNISSLLMDTLGFLDTVGTMRNVNPMKM